MAYVISDACVSCGSCESECPVEAISQGETQYEIDPDTCVDCGSCAAACPTDAISVLFTSNTWFFVMLSLANLLLNSCFMKTHFIFYLIFSFFFYI